MNEHDELGTLLTDSLHRTVDGMDRAPLTFGDVRSRARRIRRNRALAAGAGVVAAMAVIVPTAMLSLGGGDVDGPDPAESPSQTVSPTKAIETPTVTPMKNGQVALDPDARVGAGPGIAWRQGGTVHLKDGSEVEPSHPYDQFVDLGDTVVGLYRVDDKPKVEVLPVGGDGPTQTFDVADGYGTRAR